MFLLTFTSDTGTIVGNKYNYSEFLYDDVLEDFKSKLSAELG